MEFGFSTVEPSQGDAKARRFAGRKENYAFGSSGSVPQCIRQKPKSNHAVNIRDDISVI
jgi:hypothetical protein